MVQIQEVVDSLYYDSYKTNWGDSSILDCMYWNMGYSVGDFVAFGIDYDMALENFPHSCLDQRFEQKDY